MSKQTSDMEIMQAIKTLSEHMDERFESLEERIDMRFDKVWDELNDHRIRLDRIEANMVTKGQFNSLVNILRRNEVISSADAIHISYPIL